MAGVCSVAAYGRCVKCGSLWQVCAVYLLRQLCVGQGDGSKLREDDQRVLLLILHFLHSTIKAPFYPNGQTCWFLGGWGFLIRGGRGWGLTERKGGRGGGGGGGGGGEEVGREETLSDSMIS